MTTVLLADDHAVMRDGLAALLATEPDIDVVGEAADGRDCIDKALALRPDIVLMDINMPECNGLEALSQLNRLAPETRVLMLTMLDDTAYVRRVLAAGGAGYVLKQVAGDELLTAIRTVRDGGVFLHPHHARLLADERAAATERTTFGSAPTETTARVMSLSDREAEVFRLVALGHSNAEIAELMFLSVKTIETYKARLMKKLGADNRAQLVRLALEINLLS
jgi:DNA-binding NarL/FixJ family response regulator